MMTRTSASEATLVNITLDLQITICTLLHPSDILSLRGTCKTLQHPTRQRVVWIAALYRVCLDNSLFLPSFPIADMSDVELERAAIAPRRWIELCRAACKNQHPNDPGAVLRPMTTRFIRHSSVDRSSDIYIVPGGRYLVVSHWYNGIFIWDLGYTSSANCKLIASVRPEDEPEDYKIIGSPYPYMVHPTPDGMGLTIFSCLFNGCSIYEFYPQSDTPQLTRIAHLHLNPDDDPPGVRLLPDRVLWYYFHGGTITFKIWYYRMNYSIIFSSDVGPNKLKYYSQIISTETAIILLCLDEIVIWAIPSLPHQPPNFFDHHPTHIPPLSRIAFPDDIELRHHEPYPFQTMSDWYCGSSHPLYFNFLCDGKLHRFEIIVKSDLIDTSLHMINTELIRDYLYPVELGTYSICGDTFVACRIYDESGKFGAYTWSRSTTAISHNGLFALKVLLPAWSNDGYNCLLCPASGRYVHLDNIIDGIFVVDLFN